MAESTKRKSYNKYRHKKHKKARPHNSTRQSSWSSIPPLSQTLFSKEYITNKYNLLRIFVLQVTIILLFVCILYGVGSVLTLTLDDIWCKNYNWQDAYEHNYEQNSAEGVGGCYRSTLVISDIDKLLATEVSETGLKATDDINFWNIVKSMLFFSVAAILTILLFKYLFLCFSDCHKTVKNEWGRKRQRSAIAPKLLSGDRKNRCCIGRDASWSSKLPTFVWRIFVKIFDLMKQNTLTDSPVSIITLQMKESFEILLQS